jgi:hypothetical protein
MSLMLTRRKLVVDSLVPSDLGFGSSSASNKARRMVAALWPVAAPKPIGFAWP